MYWIIGNNYFYILTTRFVANINLCGRFESLSVIAKYEEKSCKLKIGSKHCLNDVDLIKRLLNINTFLECFPKNSVACEMELINFILTGNFEPLGQVVCLNPTFPQDGPWHAYYLLSCPLDAYFPIPMNEKQLAPEINRPYSYCKSKLQSLVTEFRSNSKKNRILLNFYVGDCLELCTTNQHLKNKCQVVHCSDLGDRVGLANLLPAATQLLVNDAAMLITETSAYFRSINPSSVCHFIEESLCCPISMITTLYGLRLANHLGLGSPVPLQFHDSKSAGNIKLVWHKAPTFSSNMKLGFSAELIKATLNLAKCCFITSYKLESYQLPYSPLTFYNIVHSLVERNTWIRDYLVLNGENSA